MTRFLALILLLLPALATAGYLDELQSRARQLGLAQDPQWHVLLHYARQPIFGYTRSLADDAGFFNAPDGKTNPAGELDATLAQFFNSATIPPVEQTAQCRFAARYHWLKQKLAFDPQQLPEQPCPRLDAWIAAMKPQGATLVFPSAYMNSPASMFGHTLLRIDASNQTEQTRLLAYAISYAANADPGDGMTFAIKGLTGMYPGLMANSPYYLKVREYTDMESRDIWEYQLDLGPEEIRQLLRHAWEIGSTRFDYWFFDENCSYLLLTLLDAARPGLQLADEFRWSAIPIDTVRAVVKRPGLVKKVTFRPSAGSELASRARELSPSERASAIRLAHGSPVSTVRNHDKEGRILEFSERLVSFMGQSGEISEAAGLPRLHAINLRRSELPALEDLSIAPPVAPEQGHLPARVSLASGQISGKAALTLQAHPAYHDLLDPDAGFSRGAQIRFFDMAASLRAGKSWQLDHFIPVDIVSLSPLQDWHQSPSWRVRFGLDRPMGRDYRLGPVLSGGPGLAWAGEQWMTYGYMDNQIFANNDARHGWHAGSGVLAGLLADTGASTRLQLESGHRWLNGLQQTHASVTLRWKSGQASNLTASAQWLAQNHAYASNRSWLVGWQHYF
jgi:hypothetical protein